MNRIYNPLHLIKGKLLKTFENRSIDLFKTYRKKLPIKAYLVKATISNKKGITSTTGNRTSTPCATLVLYLLKTKHNLGTWNKGPSINSRTHKDDLSFLSPLAHILHQENPENHNSFHLPSNGLHH